MNFFKNLFSKKKNNNPSQENSPPKEEKTFERKTKSKPEKDKVEIGSIETIESFEKRYKEEKIDAVMLDGTLKMIEGYFIANKLTPKIESPINHPINLDQTIDDGFGFVLYCKASKMDENFAIAILAMALNDYMIKKYGFKLYMDSEPEYPTRVMTLKYDEEGVKLSLYPAEYTAKVISYQATFEDLLNRIQGNLKELTIQAKAFKNMKDSLN